MKKSDNCLVSVIVPAYNHESYVQGALQSIIEQEYQYIELLVIDDGSQDSTWKKLQEIQKQCEERFARTVFITRENRGLCETYNELLLNTHGEFVFILNSDDKAKPETISVLCQFLVENVEYAVAVADNEIIDASGRVVFWDEQQEATICPQKGIYKTFGEKLKNSMQGIVDFHTEEYGSYAALLKHNHIPNGYLIRKSIFQKTGLYTDKAPREDHYIFLQIAKYAKIKYIDKILFSYRWHDKNTIKSQESRSLRHLTYVCEKKIVDRLDDSNIKSQFYEYIERKEYYINVAFFSAYKVRNHFCNKKYIEILGKKICIKQKY